MCRQCAKMARIVTDAKKKKEYDSDIDCPTSAPGQKSTAVSVEQQCGVDMLSLMDVMAVPPEYVVAVTLRTDIAPNSAPKWNDFHSAKDCNQLFFFDTRRSVAELETAVSACVFLNHSINHFGIPLYHRTVTRDTARRICQCACHNCPGSTHRLEALRKSLPGSLVAKRQDTSSKAVVTGVPNSCWLTSGDYDVELMNHIKDKDASEKSVAPVLRHWHLYDELSEMPLVPYSEEHTEREFINLSGKLHRLLDFSRSVEEMAEDVTHKVENTEVCFKSTLSLRALDAADVMRRRAHSHHSVPLCWQTSDGICTDLTSDVYTMEEALLNTCGMDSDGEDESGSHESTESLDRDMHEMLRSLKPANEKMAHPYGCNCLIDSFLRTHVTQQLDLVLVPTPTNPVYRDAGDSLFVAESPLMCKMLVMAAALSTGTIDTMDTAAATGESRGYAELIAQRNDVRVDMKRMFGPFTYTVVNGHATNIRSTDQRQSQHAFGRHADRLASKTRQACLPVSSYDKLLSESKRIFGAPDSIESLAELALHRGKLRDIEMLLNRVDWMPPMLVYMVRHAFDHDHVVEQFAGEVLALPKNERRIFTTSCERMICEEMFSCRNWRMAIARSAALLLIDINTMVQFRRAVVYAVCIVAIFDQALELNEALEAEKKKVVVRVPLLPLPKMPKKKKPKKEKKPVELLWPDLPLESRLRSWMVKCT